MSTNTALLSSNVSFAHHSSLLIGSCIIPHRDKVSTGGEDALAHSADGRLICLADGVGHWRRKGIDAGVYSNELCANFVAAYETVKEAWEEEVGRELKAKSRKIKEVDVKDMFVQAVEATKSKGSATFTGLCFDFEKNIVHGINFGDSGYIVIRNLGTKSPKVVFKTKKTEKDTFNRPDQVGFGFPLPTKAKKVSHKIKHDDVIVMASDGLWDNMSTSQIIDYLKK